MPACAAIAAWFRRNEELTLSIVHLAVFLFVMSAIVYETQHWTNPQIANYIDALYFTVDGAHDHGLR